MTSGCLGDRGQGSQDAMEIESGEAPLEVSPIAVSARVVVAPVEPTVSGANFVVADTGTIVIVESEGNGRMCLTLPDVLISVMGIEKLVPTWRDLEVFLQLLPRSSTAERMNPHTSMWTGLTPGDGVGVENPDSR